MRYSQHTLGVVAITAAATNSVSAFSWSNIGIGRLPGKIRINNGIGNGGMNANPPNGPKDDMHWMNMDDDGGGDGGMMGASILGIFIIDNVNIRSSNTNSHVKETKDLEEVEEEMITRANLGTRGGSTNTATPTHTPPKLISEDVVAGSKASLETTTSYWSNALKNAQQKVKNILPTKKGEGKSQEDEVLEELRTTPIQSVTTPSEILPPAILRSAVQRSGLLGKTLHPSRVKECAKDLKQWYHQKGYILHSVTGATLNVDDDGKGIATLNVEEPVVNDVPVSIQFAKEVLIDPDSDDEGDEETSTTTMRKYRQKLERRKGRPLRLDEWQSIASTLNTTLIPTSGRTRPSVLSSRLRLHPQQHFQWNANRWRNIASSGIFSKIWRATPLQMDDGTVQLQIVAQESPPRNLEYGITKSLYTGHWEGELDFKHENLLGGGESLGMVVRRGARDPIPSISLRFSDDKFGMSGGYDVDAFSEYIATGREMEVNNVRAEGSNSEEEDTDADGNTASPSANTFEDDTLLGRKGVKVSLRGPIPQSIILRSSASASVEQTSTRRGAKESIASAMMGLGPITRDLHLGARASFLTKTTAGARLGVENKDLSSKSLLPYSSTTATSRQIFPLLTNSRARADSGRGVDLAIQHTLTAATQHLPLHEANAAGVAARVRGYPMSANGAVDSALTGTAEIRIPLTLRIPFLKKEKQVNLRQDGNVVLFGDYLVATRKTGPGERGYGYRKDDVFGKSSVGIGVRKTIQGIPLKYDFSLTRDGKVGAFFGLGQDWDIL